MSTVNYTMDKELKCLMDAGKMAGPVKIAAMATDYQNTTYQRQMTDAQRDSSMIDTRQRNRTQDASNTARSQASADSTFMSQVRSAPDSVKQNAAAEMKRYWASKKAESDSIYNAALKKKR